MAIEDTSGPDSRAAKWTILGVVAALGAIILVSTWLAFSISVDTGVGIDKDGVIHIRGTESKFVGYATGTYAGQKVLIEGLPTPDVFEELPIAWRAVCAVRDDPATDWSNAEPMLKIHLHSDLMTKACRPFEGLKVDPSPAE